MKVLKWLDENLEKSICVVLMCIMTTLVFVQVIMRYVFKNSLSWSEELARYVFIWLIYLGISYGAKMRKHIKIDAALLLFPKVLRKWVVVIGDILFLAFACYLTKTGFDYCVTQAELGKCSAALGIPFPYVYSAVVVGFALTVIRQIQTLIYRFKCIKNGEEYVD